jgi:AcrR family transcriptional regulator
MSHTHQAIETGDPVTRGRPRSPEADRAIMAATMKLLSERGFSGLSIEAVAAEAGVGKTTIYRRYASKTELVIDAMSNKMSLDDIPDTGSLRGDLLSLHSHSLHGQSLQLLAGGGSTLIGTVLAEKERHPELLDTFRRLVTDRRREQFKYVVARAKSRGEIDESFEADYLVPLVFGSILLRTIAGMEVNDRIIEKIVDIALNGVLKR